MKPRQEILQTHPTLKAWLDEYAAIEGEWMDQLRQYGVRFASRDQDTQAIASLRARLAEKGARIRNGGASVSVGAISSACLACTGDRGSQTFFLSLACNRSCYFCFNANQEGYDESHCLKPRWRDEVQAYLNGPDTPTHAALTGGEPLLHKPQAEEFFQTIHTAAPEVHLRLYTSGDFLDEATAQALADAGLQEMRLSVKLGEGADEDAAAIAQAMEVLKRAKEYIPDVMVEMPVIPGTEDAMRTLMRAMDEAGMFGINLLEFCFPLNNWEEYERRGFTVKNPAFAVLYEYGYAGGLPIAGSERACLELVEFALDEGFTMGVHYCSLDNKNRDQILQVNAVAAPFFLLYHLDKEDFFLKALKVFDDDTPVAKKRLEEAGRPYVEGIEDGSLTFSLDDLELVCDLAVARSINVAVDDGVVEADSRKGNDCGRDAVIETDGRLRRLRLRELKLELL